jgi:type I restriction enzyme S subunit
MSELKRRWRRVRFGDVVRQVKDRVEPATAGLKRFIAGEHMETDDLRIRRWGDVGDGYLGPAFNMRFRPGQVLYGSRRTYLRKVAFADFEGICANTTFVLEAADPSVLLPQLLPFIMQTGAFHEHSKRESKGSVNPYVNFSDLAWYEFALPPLEEQRRIVHGLLAADSFIHAADYLHGTSRIAFHSTLVHVHLVAGRGRKTVPLVDLVESDRPISYGILMPGTGFAGGVPVIKVKDFPNGEIDDTDLLLTDPAIEHEYRRSRLRADDLLVSIRGTIGRIAVVPPHLQGANITQDTARLSFPASINVEYMRAILESAEIQREMHSNIPPPAPAGEPPARAKPRPAIQGLNIGELRRVRVPAPPRSIQDTLAEAAGAARSAMAVAATRVHQSRELRGHILSRAVGTES